MSFFLKSLSWPDQAQEIAKIRNTGRQFMTRDQHEISQYEQTQWYEKTYITGHLNDELHAFVGYDGPDAVAYGLVRRIEGKLWLTGVVVPAAQGKGYGKELFTFLAEFALHRAPEVWLDVLETNEKAQGLYTKLGFELVEADGDTFVMVKRGGVR